MKRQPGLPLDLAASMSDYHVPGIAVAVFQEGRITLAEGYGVLEAGTQRAVAADNYPYLAAAGLWITPTELARLALDVLSAWNGDTDLILRPDLARLMLTGSSVCSWHTHAGSAGSS